MKEQVKEQVKEQEEEKQRSPMMMTGWTWSASPPCLAPAPAPVHPRSCWRRRLVSPKRRRLQAHVMI